MPTCRVQLFTSSTELGHVGGIGGAEDWLGRQLGTNRFHINRAMVVQGESAGDDHRGTLLVAQGLKIAYDLALWRSFRLHQTPGVTAEK